MSDLTALAEPEWRPVVGYEGLYEVSSDGEVRSARTKRVRKRHVMGAGYIQCPLWKDGGCWRTSMHRVVAMTFLGEPNGREVNHKNGIRTDNRVENLEWVTKSYNNLHARYVLGSAVHRVKATHLQTGEETVYPSIEFAVGLGFRSGHIYLCIAGKRKSHKGFKWESLKNGT